MLTLLQGWHASFGLPTKLFLPFTNVCAIFNRGFAWVQSLVLCAYSAYNKESLTSWELVQSLVLCAYSACNKESLTSWKQNLILKEFWGIETRANITTRRPWQTGVLVSLCSELHCSGVLVSLCSELHFDPLLVARIFDVFSAYRQVGLNTGERRMISGCAYENYTSTLC